MKIMDFYANFEIQNLKRNVAEVPFHVTFSLYCGALTLEVRLGIKLMMSGSEIWDFFFIFSASEYNTSFISIKRDFLLFSAM